MPLIYQNRLYRLTEEKVPLPDGREKTFTILHHPGAAAVVATTEDGESVVLLRQFRPVVQKWVWEIPAGMLDAGETPQTCAERELAEETGWSAKDFRLIAGFHPAQGYCDETIHIFRATLVKPGTSALEDAEIAETHLLSKASVLEMLARGDITDSKTVLGLCHAWDLFSLRNCPASF